MKLYTEEQVRDMLNINVDFDHYTPSIDFILNDYSPIELPSDEEIIAKSKQEPDNSDIETAARIGYVAGAIWMRNKIQGGNK